MTGAFGSIGSGVVQTLLECGADVMGLDVVAPGADIAIEGDQPKFRVVDVSDPAMAEHIPQQIKSELGPFDIWVNAAYPRTDDWGIAASENDAETWNSNVSMQMTATCLLTESAASVLADNASGGTILNIASIYGMVAPQFSVYQGTAMNTPPAYTAIKAGIINHTRYVAAKYGPKGVRANVLAPGGVEAGQPESFVKRYSDQTHLGRMATSEDISGAAAFLVSDAAAYITGVVLPVDGGWTAS